MQGPTFWPKTQSQPLSTDCELKTTTRIFRTSVEDTRLLKCMSRYSSLNKLLNRLSFLFRWKVKSKTKTNEKEATLVDVRAAAKSAIIRVFQRLLFNEEIQSLQAGKPLKESNLSSLLLSCLRMVFVMYLVNR